MVNLRKTNFVNIEFFIIALASGVLISCVHTEGTLTIMALADLAITINRKSKAPVCDTLTLSWESNGVDERFLYPYKINNYGKTNNSFGLTSDMELRWIGGNFNSTINTKVFADKRAKLLWELYRNGKRKVLTDTITCKRGFVNIVNFTY